MTTDSLQSKEMVRSSMEPTPELMPESGNSNATDVASRIKRIFELDGERNNPHKSWALREYEIGGCPYAITNPNGDAELGNWMVANVRWQPDAEFIAAAPEAVSIIKELLVVIEKQRSDFEALIIEAEGAANIYMAGELWQYCQKAKKQIALSAPYVNLLKE
jgi:hypothetical protein